MEPIAVNVIEAARLIGISKSHLYDLISEGKITARKLGNRTVFSVEELRRFVEAAPALECERAR